jgi:predicted O-methyltransferase YrrM
MNLDNAVQIEGWMTTNELYWLAEQAATCKTIVEIGSWKGRSTRALADNTPGTVYAVDTWAGSDGLAELLKDKPEGWVKGEFLKNMAGLQNVEAVQMTSMEAAALFQGQGRRFDMVFIDGDHSYESVKADITAWRALLVEGGLISGHDYSWTGVIQAVDELLPNRKTGDLKMNWIWYDRV